MSDSDIIQLYFSRSKNAITETDKKYGKYCFLIANAILQEKSDSEECVNDTYLKVWNTIPPQTPTNFKSFIGTITRNISINRYHYNTAKRRNETLNVVVDEFNYIFSSVNIDYENTYAIKVALNKFLKSLPKKHRIIFVRRYWYCLSIAEIASQLNVSSNNVKVILHRLKEKLKKYLIKEDIFL